MSATDFTAMGHSAKDTGFKRRRASAGFTLIELATAIIVVGLLSAFAVMSFGSLDERSDAALVQAVQASLQTIVAQAATRRDTQADLLDATAVRNALNTNIPDKVQFTSLGATAGNGFQMAINTGRTIQFGVEPDADVIITSISGFSNFVVGADGTLVHN